MGRYYRPILGNVFGTDCKVFDRSVDGERTFAKLMEHSWWENPFVNSFSSRLYNECGRVAWVGDYADEPNDFHFPHCSAFYVPCYSEVWGDDVQALGSTATDFTLDGKFLVNCDTEQFVDLSEYKTASADKHGWAIHPLPLLTANYIKKPRPKSRKVSQPLSFKCKCFRRLRQEFFLRNRRP